MPVSLSHAETIAAPPDVVWAALIDISGWADWVPNLVRLELLSDGPVGLHTSWCEVRRVFDREASEEYRVIALEPPRMLELHVDGCKGATARGEYRFRYRLEPVAMGTRVQLDTDILGMGWLFKRVVGKLFHRGMRHALATDLAAFKHHVESQPAR